MTRETAAVAGAARVRSSVVWPIIEVTVAVALIVAGLLGFIPFSSTPAMLLAAAVFFRWRGPGWRAVGLRWPASPGRTLAIGLVVGVLYQFLGLYVIEPVIARVSSGALPDASAFRPLIGDEVRLAFWLVLVWTLAAFMEELVFRGWIMTRVAEAARFSVPGWVAAVIVSSAMFGAVHLYQGASGVIATGLTGAVFAGLYLGTGRNLWASILAHGSMDTVGFVMIYLGVYPGL